MLLHHFEIQLLHLPCMNNKTMYFRGQREFVSLTHMFRTFDKNIWMLTMRKMTVICGNATSHDDTTNNSMTFKDKNYVRWWFHIALFVCSKEYAKFSANSSNLVPVLYTSINNWFILDYQFQSVKHGKFGIRFKMRTNIDHTQTCSDGKWELFFKSTINNC